LTYNIRPEGNIRVELLPFRQLVDDEFVDAVARLIRKNVGILEPILALCHISYAGASKFVRLKDAFTPDEIGVGGITLFSPSYYFPVDVNRGLSELLISFVTLYPLIDSFVSIGEGETPRLPHFLKQFMQWWAESVPTDGEETEKTKDDVVSSEELKLPELDSYRFVRAGLWWTVLARDNWTCRSCRRTAKDGVTLEVDHIIPRSKGGTDDMDNLQTLCKKCNIGKSNNYTTDLR